ncbi:hypothetical protein [Streptomyces seoulensis]|uniref:hypothetical protein n=1 Tax=Streptomyces seoulensis TaxID=73044 RepID=UPI001FCC721E|nr:hypothetical protein [Streptomyces seoulensis]BDH04876.1 hypothetical protein HEK131_21030 [Streptomyces seoulensis]
MQHTARPRTALDDLQTVVDHWSDMRALIDTSQNTGTWPPTMGRAEYLRALDDHDRDETARSLEHAQHLVTRYDEHGRPQYECTRCDYVGEGRAHTPRPDRDGIQLGERPVPLRLHVVDACRAVEAALCALADQVAADIQRDTIKPLIRAIPGDPTGLALAMLAARDEADPARWHFTMGERTAVRAAEWLIGRLRGDTGPCLPLRDHHRAHIAGVAREAARRVDRTIGGTGERHAIPMDGRPCPYCGSVLTMHSGGGLDDEVTCAGPGCDAPVGLVDGRRTWSRPEQLAALQRDLEDAARRRKRADARARQRAEARARADAA